jgi:DNA-binding protein HU-beta
LHPLSNLRIIKGIMTKAEIVNNISGKLGLEKSDTQRVVESFMEEVIKSLVDGENVYLRGFGSFTIKTRAEKTGRNITKGTSIIIPAHNVPTFKPAKTFIEDVKTSEANVVK